MFASQANLCFYNLGGHPFSPVIISTIVWYNDYLIVTDRYATATGLSSILEGKISHDKITRYLICSDLTTTYQQIITLYQRRWKVEEYHRSKKNNTALSKSPTHVMRSQENHIFVSIVAFFKLEVMKQKTKMNHYTMKSSFTWPPSNRHGTNWTS